MKAFYLSNSEKLTDELRGRLRGHRVENADAFNGVAQQVTEAEVVGDYPNILQALNDAGVEVSGGDKGAELFDVFKVVDGERAKRASKHNITQDEAETFVKDNPDNTYEIVQG